MKVEESTNETDSLSEHDIKCRRRIVFIIIAIKKIFILYEKKVIMIVKNYKKTEEMICMVCERSLI